MPRRDLSPNHFSVWNESFQRTINGLLPDRVGQTTLHPDLSVQQWIYGRGNPENRYPIFGEIQ